MKVRVCEYTLNEQGEEIPFEPNEHGDYPDTKAGGSDISRIVRVENVGTQPEYVRARLRMTSVAPDGSSADARATCLRDAGEGPRGSMAAMGGTTTADWPGVAARSTPAP